MNIKEEHIEGGAATGGSEIDWSECPEALELKKQMASLEEKISNFKKEIEEEGDDDEKGGTMEEGRWSRPVYTTDPNLPKGWTFFRNREGFYYYFVKLKCNYMYLQVPCSTGTISGSS